MTVFFWYRRQSIFCVLASLIGLSISVSFLVSNWTFYCRHTGLMVWCYGFILLVASAIMSLEPTPDED